MLVKILGGIDLFGGLILLFGAGMSLPFELLIGLGILFLIKTFIWGIPKAVGSWIDLGAGIVLILMGFFSVFWLIPVICAILVLQKGFFSFF